jgi:hypothetical protein
MRLPEGFHDVAAAHTHNRLRRQNLKHHKEIARNARTMTALELAAQLPQSPDPEPISSKVVRMFRPQIEAPCAAQFDDDNEFNDSPEEQAQWRRYEALKRRPVESLDADDIAAMKVFEHSMTYRVRQIARSSGSDD